MIKNVGLINQAPTKYKSNPCKSAVEEVFEPEIHIMPVGVSSLFVLKTMSLVRVKHEFKFFAEVYEFVDQLHAVLIVKFERSDPDVPMFILPFLFFQEAVRSRREFSIP